MKTDAIRQKASEHLYDVIMCSLPANILTLTTGLIYYFAEQLINYINNGPWYTGAQALRVVQGVGTYIDLFLQNCCNNTRNYSFIRNSEKRETQKAVNISMDTVCTTKVRERKRETD